MNNERHTKAENELHLLEDEIISSLLRYLPVASKNGADLVSIDRWNPNNDFVSTLREKSERCLELRKTLALEISDSPGELFIRAHKEASDLKNQHRRGPRRLAEWLLGEIQARYAI